MLTRSALKMPFAPGLAALSLLAGPAHAGQIIGAPVLGPVSVNGDVAISLADYAVVLTAPGTKNLVGPIFIPDGPGIATQACTASGFCNYGTGEISATLGTDPTALLSATPANNGGGDSSLDVSYQVEYYTGTGAQTPVSALLLVGDTVDPGGPAAAAQAIMTVSGINGTVYLGYNCAAGPDAAFSCGTNVPNLPFADQQLNMITNTVYTVDMDLMIYAHDPVLAKIDPMFVGPAGGTGEFIFSAGITEGGVPEPTTWALMVVGFLGAGAALRGARAR